MITAIMNNEEILKLSASILKVRNDIERRRKNAKITQSEVAEAVDVTLQTYQRWAAEQFNNCSLKKFTSILEFLESKGVNTNPLV